MKRPWQIWSLFGVGLAIVLPAMGWLTVKALELDRAESVASQQAELEESTSRALWRLDALLTPLLAQEAARPDFVYRPLYNSTAPAVKGAETKAISPLLIEPPDFVLLHFELHPDGRMTSPQAPTGSEQQWAMQNGATTARIDIAKQNLKTLSAQLSHNKLLAELPDESLPEVLVSNSAGWNGNATLAPENNSLVVANTYSVPTQQLEQQRYGNPQQASDFGDVPSDVEQLQRPTRSVAQATQQSLQPEPQTAQGGSEGPQLNEEFPQPNQPVSQAVGPPGLSQMANRNSDYGQYSVNPRSQSRGGKDLVSRDAAYQAYAQKAVSEQRQNYKQMAVPTERVIEGVSRPLWIGDRLILARRVHSGNVTLIQGCWLDWEKLQSRMYEEISDLLRNPRLSPVTADEPPANARLLATLPVQLTVPSPTPSVATFSPMRISLLVAWICVIATACAAAATLMSVVALSERRADFVAAVSHELRTPLTTFRMYAEMLAEGMVPEAAQRQRYLETLRVEADRLHHLVENVLQYARLERGSPGRRRELIELGGLLDRLVPRLADRASQADMQLVLELNKSDRSTPLHVDVGAVEQILFNLVDNACKYAAGTGDHGLNLEAEVRADECLLRVRDHGPGISREGRRKLFQPFSKSVHEAATSAPGVGLGLALCRRLARDMGGRLELLPGDAGAAFQLSLPRSPS
jgi:signal transduction histidine kinase